MLLPGQREAVQWNVGKDVSDADKAEILELADRVGIHNPRVIATDLSTRENLGVTGGTLPIGPRLDLVASSDECRLGASRDAAIDEHLHVSGW
jgi:hypothetical protein